MEPLTELQLITAIEAIVERNKKNVTLLDDEPLHTRYEFMGVELKNVVAIEDAHEIVAVSETYCYTREVLGFGRYGVYEVCEIDDLDIAHLKVLLSELKDGFVEAKTLSERISEVSTELYAVREKLFALYLELFDEKATEVELSNGFSTFGFLIDFTTEDDKEVEAIAESYVYFRDGGMRSMRELTPTDLDYILGELA